MSLYACIIDMLLQEHVLVALNNSCHLQTCNVSLQERELCATARLLPAHYLELKALMLRDAQRRGCLPRAEAKGFFRLDAARAVK